MTDINDIQINSRVRLTKDLPLRGLDGLPLRGLDGLDIVVRKGRVGVVERLTDTLAAVAFRGRLRVWVDRSNLKV
jgi:hypothetical protein